MSFQPPPGDIQPPELPGELPELGYPGVPYGVPRRYTPPPRPPFDYTGLIKGTLSLTWRNKFLWFFGLFAGGSTTFGGCNGNFNYSSGDSGTQPSTRGEDNVSEWISSHIGLLVGIGIALLIIGILIWLWSIICRGAVIGASSDIRDGQRSGFGAAFRRGRASFGRLLLLDLLLLAIGMGIFIIITAFILLLVFMAVSLGDAGVTVTIIIASIIGLWALGLLMVSLGYLTCFTGGIAIWVPITLLILYATRAIVLNGSGPMDALRMAWRLMIAMLSRSLLLFLLSTGLSIVANIGAFIVAGISAVPAIVVWIITGTNDWPVSGIIAASLLSIIPLIMLLLVTALINTYFTSFWTIIYRRLTGMEPMAGQPQPAAVTPYPPAPSPGI